MPRDGFVRALAAAWQIQQLVGASSRHRTPYGNFTVSVKVGVAAGEEVWGIVSSPGNDRATHYFQGPAIDDCANAEKLAWAGEIEYLKAFAKAIQIADLLERRLEETKT